MLGIIGAMKIEIDAIVGCMENKKETVISGVTYFSGRLWGADAVVAQCGVGKVFAGICAQTMILKFNTDHIINIGVGGSLTIRLNVCDIGIGTAVVQHDMDTSALGDPVGLISGINKVEIPCDIKMCQALKKAATALGINCCDGVIASGDCFVSDNAKKNYITDTFGAIVCEMEGAAIGQVCFVNGVPFNVIRGVSDNADGSADMSFEKFTEKAVEQSVKLLKLFMEEYYGV